MQPIDPQLLEELSLQDARDYMLRVIADEGVRMGAADAAEMVQHSDLRGAISACWHLRQPRWTLETLCHALQTFGGYATQAELVAEIDNVRQLDLDDDFVDMVNGWYGDPPSLPLSRVLAIGDRLCTCGLSCHCIECTAAHLETVRTSSGFDLSGVDLTTPSLLVRHDEEPITQWADSVDLVATWEIFEYVSTHGLRLQLGDGAPTLVERVAAMGPDAQRFVEHLARHSTSNWIEVPRSAATA